MAVRWGSDRALSSIQVNEDLVADLARAMLDRAAAVEPDRVAAELRVFPALRTAYFADPQRALARCDRGGGKLQFGPPGVEELLTPVLLFASAEVLRYLADRGAAAARTAVRRLLSSTAPDDDAATDGSSADDTPTDDTRAGDTRAGDTRADDISGDSVGPTADQWVEIRSIVTTTLVRHAQMPRPRAELIAAAVVGEGLTARRSA